MLTISNKANFLRKAWILAVASLTCALACAGTESEAGTASEARSAEEVEVEREAVAAEPTAEPTAEPAAAPSTNSGAPQAATAAAAETPSAHPASPPIGELSTLAGRHPLGCRPLYVQGERLLRPEFPRGAPSWVYDRMSGDGVDQAVPAAQASLYTSLDPVYLLTAEGPCRAELGPLWVRMQEGNHDPEFSHVIGNCAGARAPLALSCAQPPPPLRWVPLEHDRIRRLRPDVPSGDPRIDTQRREFLRHAQPWERELWANSTQAVQAGERRLWHRSRISHLRAPAAGLQEQLDFVEVHWAFHRGARPHGSCPDELFSYRGYAQIGSRSVPLRRTPQTIDGGLHDGRRFVALIWHSVASGALCDGAASCIAHRLAHRSEEDRFLAQARVAHDWTAGNLSLFGDLSFYDWDCMP